MTTTRATRRLWRKCFIAALWTGRCKKNGVARSLYGAYLQLVMSLVRKREDGMISSLHNDLMNNLWNARFDLSEETKEIGYTEDYVRRLFRDRYGKTPLQFLLSERIEYAKKLLDIYGRQMSIKEIAEMCGFSDPLYFSLMFKRAEGKVPRRLQKRAESDLWNIYCLRFPSCSARVNR